MEAPDRKADVAVSDRATASCAQLALTHQTLRDRLHALRGQLRSGGATVSPPELLEHCAGFCAAPQAHHAGEDEALFPAVRREFPQLAPTIGELAEDHWLIAGILRWVAELAGAGATSADNGRIAGELDGLAAIVESHFTFEERRGGAAIDALAAGPDEIGVDGWSADAPGGGQSVGPPRDPYTAPP